MNVPSRSAKLPAASKIVAASVSGDFKMSCTINVDSLAKALGRTFAVTSAGVNIATDHVSAAEVTAFDAFERFIKGDQFALEVFQYQLDTATVRALLGANRELGFIGGRRFAFVILRVTIIFADDGHWSEGQHGLGRSAAQELGQHVSFFDSHHWRKRLR